MKLFPSSVVAILLPTLSMGAGSVLLAAAQASDGKPVSHFGKYVSIWKKQPDGAWKVVINIGTPSPAPAANSAR